MQLAVNCQRTQPFAIQHEGAAARCGSSTYHTPQKPQVHNHAPLPLIMASLQRVALAYVTGRFTPLGTSSQKWVHQAALRHTL
jgi:hypothetical protein